MSLDDARFAIRNALDRLEGFAAEVDPPTFFPVLAVQVGMNCGEIPRARSDERTFALSWESMVGDFYRMEVERERREPLFTKDTVLAWKEQDECETKGLPFEPSVCTGFAVAAIIKHHGGPALGPRLPNTLATIGTAANVLAAAEGFGIKAPNLTGETLWLAHVVRLAIQRPAAFGAGVRWLHINSVILDDPPAWGGFQASLDARPLYSPGSYVVVLEQDIRTASATAARLMLDAGRPSIALGDSGEWIEGTMAKLCAHLRFSKQYTKKLRRLHDEGKIVLENPSEGHYRMKVLDSSAYNPHPPGDGGR